MRNLLETMFTYARFRELKLKFHLENKSIHLVARVKMGMHPFVEITDY